MSQVASEALATAHGNARTNARHQSARRDPAEAGPTPFAALIDRADAGSDSEAGTRADRFRVANDPVEPSRRADQNQARPRAGDHRHTDQTQTDRMSEDRKPADRRDVREAPDRHTATGVDKRNDVNSAENDATKSADYGDVPEDAKATEDSNSAPTGSGAAGSVEQPGSDAASPAKGDKTDVFAATIAVAISPTAAGQSAAEQAAAEASGGAKPVLAVPADAARAVLPEAVTAESAPVKADLAIESVPQQPAEKLAVEETDGLTEATVNHTETAANKPTGSATDDVALRAQTTIDGSGETAPGADAKPADGETGLSADAGKSLAASADNASATGKAADAPPAVANAAHGSAAPGTASHSAHNPIHAPQAQHASPVAVAQAADTSAVSRAQPVPIEGLAVEIAARAHSGKNSFEIRLDPPELGRIEVRLDVDRTGQVTSRLVVDRIDTLDLLRRDAAGLERALQDAGLKTSDNGLQFSLRDQFLDQQASRESRDTAEIIVRDETAPVEIAHRGYRSLASARGGVDIRV